MAKRSYSLSPIATEATRLLGTRIAVARRERHWSLDELAERVGVSRVTMRKIERGDPTVGLGLAFETAAVLGVPLFDEDPARRRLEVARGADRLAVLPARVRKPTKVNDDF